MKNWKQWFSNTEKKSGLTLIELLVAMTLAVIVLSITANSIGGIYFTQKKISISQDFFKEARFLKQAMIDVIRDNTVDYDRYFERIGPNSCNTFDTRQVPNGASTANANVRANQSYESVFYWDTDSDGEQDRQLGGVDLASADDDCVQALHETSNNTLVDYGGTSMASLFLINKEFTTRSAFRKLDTFDDLNGNGTQQVGEENFSRIEKQTQLGADTDSDGKPDLWGPFDANFDGDTADSGDVQVQWDSGNTQCKLSVVGGSNYVISGDFASIEECFTAHDWTPISIRNIDIQNLDFSITPDRDPYLAFRVTSAQRHPLITLQMTAALRNYLTFGFTEPLLIETQSSASSRIFGNIRK